MHNFHDVYHSMPPQALANDKGKRLLSWRVLILPYLDEMELYQRFRLDEPWDSEHNRALGPLMPAVFQLDPGDRSEDHQGRTRFVAPLTPDSILGRPGQAVRIQEITDGTSNTVMIVQASPDHAVVWTKPEDLLVDPDQPLAGLVATDAPGFHCNFGDGSAHFLPNTITAKTMNALLSISGGEIISAEDLRGEDR
ncbi:MAG: DUF1559 domain-containing protein [Planctomycetaceae bacterium]|nr:DUF1559 domain-containing protein [Planctomycetaceae bacterium]